MTIYNREDSRTVLPQLEKRVTELEENKVYMATVDKTTYREAVSALKRGELLFAKVENSYGTYNIYPYCYHGTSALVFARIHWGSAPQCKIVFLNDDDTWETRTYTLATT